MNIGERAFTELYPNKQLPTIEIRYSRRFKAYNANVSKRRNAITFSFSHVWEDIGDEIQIGLAQHLLKKLYKTKATTINEEIYQKFIDQVGNYANHTDDAPEQLKESFDRVNEQYFDGFLDQPKLEWGKRSTTTLGTYSYHTDTVRISTVFQQSESWMLDYVMYHELLHKKFGIQYTDGGSCRHHTPEFRKLEAKFTVQDAEKKLQAFIRRKKPVRVHRRGWMRNLFK